MVFSEGQIERINSYIGNEEFKKLCIDLNICAENDKDDLLGKIKEYIENDMMGKFRGQSAIEKFLRAIEIYLGRDEFKRDEDGYIDYNLVLPIGKLSRRNGLRVETDKLGHDRKRYIVKAAEGVKGNVSGLKNSKDAKYNPTIAYGLFKFLGEPCSRNLVAYEMAPYYYIFSENFVKENEKSYGLDDSEFIGTKFFMDEKKNITHKQILDGIEETMSNKNLSSELIKKVKLQYAVQETLKCLICSMDQNLGNTSIVIKQDENGQIEDANISPAYDIDLSFNLGEEMLRGIPETQVLYRTTQDGKIDLASLINEFKDIEGYEEVLQNIRGKLNENYIDQIFDMAYEDTRIEKFNDKNMREKYGNFLMRRVAIFKEACRTTFEREDRTKTE